ncbi:hypothetical protein AB5I41_25890 [Sphingomonas sp. MMS24-JH45]
MPALAPPFALVLALAPSTPAVAQATAPGTTIENVARLSYGADTDARTVASNPAVITVARLVDVAVVAASDTRPFGTTSQARVEFEVHNTGNDAERFVLTAGATPAAASVAGILAGATAEASPTEYALAAGERRTVVVLVDLATDSRADAAVTLTATAASGHGRPRRDAGGRTPSLAGPAARRAPAPSSPAASAAAPRRASRMTRHAGEIAIGARAGRLRPRRARQRHHLPAGGALRRRHPRGRDRRRHPGGHRLPPRQPDARKSHGAGVAIATTPIRPLRRHRHPRRARRRAAHASPHRPVPDRHPVRIPPMTPALFRTVALAALATPLAVPLAAAAGQLDVRSGVMVETKQRGSDGTARVTLAPAQRAFVPGDHVVLTLDYDEHRKGAAGEHRLRQSGAARTRLSQPRRRLGRARGVGRRPHLRQPLAAPRADPGRRLAAGATSTTSPMCAGGSTVRSAPGATGRFAFQAVLK